MTNGAGWQILDVPAFDERVDTLWSRAQSQFLFGIVRSSAYLNWRYADRRAGDYTILVAEEENRWLGYIVLRTHRDRGYICDLLTLPDRAGVADSLLASALDRFRGDGFRHVEAWSDVGSVYRWPLDRAGFRTLRRSIGLTFRPLRFPPEDAAFLNDPMAPVLFSAGDTDLV
jgi:hypothetical protein